MRRYLNLVLLYVLMLASPLQGFAAASSSLCGPVHHAPTSASAEHQHEEISGALREARYADHEHATNQAEVPGTEASYTFGDDVAASKCSTCASCCVGAAIPPSALNWTAVYHAGTAEPSAFASPFSGYIPEGLKRPPRLFLG